jgi:hypothetical protein
MPVRPITTKALCLDVARLALRNVKGANAMDIQELADRLEDVCNEVAAVVAHENTTEVWG